MLGAYHVQGLADAQRALRSVDGQAQRQLTRAGNRAVRRIVARAQANATTPMERAAAATLRGASQQRYASVKLGRKAVPFALGAEFGAYRNNMRRRRAAPGMPTRWTVYRGYRQFKPWRGSDSTTGYFMWPAIRSERSQVAQDYFDEITQVLRANGLL